MMSKRLQVVVNDEEYRALAAAARRREQPVAAFVRDALRRSLEDEAEPTPEERIAAILRFARFAGPTGDIEEVLAEIEEGRGLT